MTAQPCEATTHFQAYLLRQTPVVFLCYMLCAVYWLYLHACRKQSLRILPSTFQVAWLNLAGCVDTL
jgi:hypothetical protein